MGVIMRRHWILGGCAAIVALLLLVAAAYLSHEGISVLARYPKDYGLVNCRLVPSKTHVGKLTIECDRPQNLLVMTRFNRWRIVYASEGWTDRDIFFECRWVEYQDLRLSLHIDRYHNFEECEQQPST